MRSLCNSLHRSRETRHRTGHSLSNFECPCTSEFLAYNFELSGLKSGRLAIQPFSKLRKEANAHEALLWPSRSLKSSLPAHKNVRLVALAVNHKSGTTSADQAGRDTYHRNAILCQITLAKLTHLPSNLHDWWLHMYMALRGWFDRGRGPHAVARVSEHK
jgi:hypothetical protein